MRGRERENSGTEKKKEEREREKGPDKVTQFKVKFFSVRQETTSAVTVLNTSV